jgi:hypothetical protein
MLNGLMLNGLLMMMMNSDEQTQVLKLKVERQQEIFLQFLSLSLFCLSLSQTKKRNVQKGYVSTIHDPS